MKIACGILGYLILLCSSAFLDVPVIGIIAMLTLVLGIVLIIAFYFSLINQEYSNKWLAKSLFITGILLLSGAAGYSAVEFTEYLAALSANTVAINFPSPWLVISQITGVNLLASLIVFIGLKQGSYLKKKSLYLAWTPTLILVPLVVLLIKILGIIGAPPGA